MVVGVADTVSHGWHRNDDGDCTARDSSITVSSQRVSSTSAVEAIDAELQEGNAEKTSARICSLAANLRGLP